MLRFAPNLLEQLMEQDWTRLPLFFFLGGGVSATSLTHGCGSKNSTQNGNPGKSKHGLKPAVPQWFSFDPHPHEWNSWHFSARWVGLCDSHLSACHGLPGCCQDDDTPSGTQT